MASAIYALALSGNCAESAPSTGDGNASQSFSRALALSPKAEGRPRITVNSDYSYVFGTKASFGREDSDNSGAQSVTAALAVTVPVSEKWFVPLGLSTTHHFLDSAADLPIPDSIHTLRVSAGVGYNFDQRWSASLSLGPTLYKFEEVGGNDVGIAGLVTVLYRVNPGLTWAFGLNANPDSDVPVLPAVGVRWAFEPEWTLNLMFPRPIVIYHPSERWNLFAGGDIRFSVFRTDDDLGDTIGNPRYNDTRATYRDLRVGAGAEYEVLPELWASLEGGYSVWREIDFKDRDRSVDFDPSPYVQLALRYRF
jgi:hypothetical protein